MKRNIEAFTDGIFDLCIIGGGITGAGVALDAATRGWRVALIDKGDFASGTSGASSKLIHGGLRYLEYGHFSLVREALLERGRLLRNAPHLVQPLPFLLPFYRGQRMSPWLWRLGLTLYDLLAGRANIARSRPLSARWLQKTFTGLRHKDLLGGARYHDALMDDARVCITVLQTAARHGAVLANYVQATGFDIQHRGITGVWAKDHLSGDAFLIQSRAVLNAAGAWADSMCRLGGDDCSPLLEPTKGVHLVLPSLGHGSAFLLLHPRDGRVFFVIPWLGKTLLGTTDTLLTGELDSLQVEPHEIDYLLEGYNHHFVPPLCADDVMGTFAGLRPLIRSQPEHPSAKSREFRLHVSPSGLVTALGGKFTTFRQMAETIVEFLANRLGKREGCQTSALLLDGAPAEPWRLFFPRMLQSLQRRYPLAADSAAHLLHRYGARVDDVLKLIEPLPGAFERAHPEEPDLVGERAYQEEEEMAVYLKDVYLRRSRIGIWRPGVLAEAQKDGPRLLPA